MKQLNCFETIKENWKIKTNWDLWVHLVAPAQVPSRKNTEIFNGYLNVMKTWLWMRNRVGDDKIPEHMEAFTVSFFWQSDETISSATYLIEINQICRKLSKNTLQWWIGMDLYSLTLTPNLVYLHTGDKLKISTDLYWFSLLPEQKEFVTRWVRCVEKMKITSKITDIFFKGNLTGFLIVSVHFGWILNSFWHCTNFFFIFSFLRSSIKITFPPRYTLTFTERFQNRSSHHQCPAVTLRLMTVNLLLLQDVKITPKSTL